VKSIKRFIYNERNLKVNDHLRGFALKVTSTTLAKIKDMAYTQK